MAPGSELIDVVTGKDEQVLLRVDLLTLKVVTELFHFVAWQSNLCADARKKVVDLAHVWFELWICLRVISCLVSVIRGDLWISWCRALSIAWSGY